MPGVELKGFEQLFKLQKTSKKQSVQDESYLLLSTIQLQAGEYQPRLKFNEVELKKLAESIKLNGVLQPIIVRSVKSNRYEIIAGERRWRAACMIGLDKIPAVVREVSDDTALVFGLVENVQREGLNPVDKLMALTRLQDEFKLTHLQVAKSIGLSRSSVTNLMRLSALPVKIKEYLKKGVLGVGHAKSLLTLEQPEQLRLVDEIIQKKYSVRVTEELVAKQKHAGFSSNYIDDKGITGIKNKKIRTLNDTLSTRLSSAVHVNLESKEQGKVVIEFDSREKLDWLVDHLDIKI